MTKKRFCKSWCIPSPICIPWVGWFSPHCSSTPPLWMEPVDVWDSEQCSCIQQAFNSPQYISVFHLWCPPGGTGYRHVYKQVKLPTVVIISFSGLHWAWAEQCPSLLVPGVCKTSCNPHPAKWIPAVSAERHHCVTTESKSTMRSQHCQSRWRVSHESISTVKFAANEYPHCGDQEFKSIEKYHWLSRKKTPRFTTNLCHHFLAARTSVNKYIEGWSTGRVKSDQNSLTSTLRTH